MRERLMYYTFRTPNAFCVFDTAAGEILEISEDLYLYLNYQKDTPSLEGQAELDQLQAEDLLVPEAIREVKHILIDDVDAILDRCVGGMTLQVTQNCNFRCTYCVFTENVDGHRHHNGKRMSKETAFAAIDFLWEHSIDIPIPDIGFYGGEPLLEFDLIKDVVRYAQKKFEGKMLTFSFTTNAALLNDEIIQFCENNQVNIVVSLDGPKEINDLNRQPASGKGSAFDQSMLSLKLIYEKYPELFKRTMINMVIDSEYDYDKYLQFFEEYPFLKDEKHLAAQKDTSHLQGGNVVNEKMVEKSNYHDFLSILYEMGRYKSRSQLINFSLLESTRLKVSAISPVSAPSGPCVPGAKKPLITVDGRISACEKMNEQMEASYMGDIFNGYDVEKVRTGLNIGKLTEEKCKKCYAYLFCSTCLKDAVDGDKLSAKVKLRNCFKSKMEAQCIVKHKQLIKEIRKNYIGSFGGCYGQ